MLAGRVDAALLDLEQVGEVGVDHQLERAVGGLVAEVADDDVLRACPARCSGSGTPSGCCRPGPGRGRVRSTKDRPERLGDGRGQGLGLLAVDPQLEAGRGSGCRGRTGPGASRGACRPIAPRCRTTTPRPGVTVVPRRGPSEHGRLPGEVPRVRHWSRAYREAASGISPTAVVLIQLSRWIRRPSSRSTTSTSPWRAPRSSRASTSRSAPARSTPSWAPTARASPRWPTPCSASPEYEVTGGRILFKGDDITAWPTDVRGKAGHLPGLPVPRGDRRRPGDPVPAPGPVGPQGHRPVGARAAPVDHGVDEAPRHGPVASATATSTRASRAARRSATRSCRWPSSSPSWPSSTRPTPGLDIDALRVVANGVQEVRADRPELGVLLITHYQRILDELQPDRVHILVDGRIVDSGGPELARRLEEEGYDAWRRGHVDRSTSPSSRRTSRSSTSRSTATGSSTSTRRRRRRSRRPCSTPWSATTRPPTPTCTAACTPSPCRPPSCSRRRGPRCSASSAPARARGRLHQERHRGHQPGRPLVGPGQPRRGRRRAAHRDGAPRQHRALAHAGGRAGHRAALAPLADDYQLDLTDLDRPARRREAGRRHGHVQRARHHQPGAPHRRRRPRRRRPRARRRRPVRAPPAHRRRRAGLPTSSASPATRCSAPPASACCGAARSCSTPCPPFLGGGEMIRDVRLDGFDAQRAPVEVRGRHAAHRRGHRPRRRRRLPRGARHGRRPPARDRPHRLRPRRPHASASATTSPSTARPTPSTAAA